jgi:hypothetical protein
MKGGIPMSDSENSNSKDGFSVKLWRGERMCLLGFDADDPEPDLVGFAIECRNPKDNGFNPLLNRIAFSYNQPTNTAVTGKPSSQFVSLITCTFAA